MEPAQTLHSHVALGYMIHRHRLNCLISSSGENRRREEGRVKNFVANLVRSTNEWIEYFVRAERKRETNIRLLEIFLLFAQRIFYPRVSPTN